MVRTESVCISIAIKKENKHEFLNVLINNFKGFRNVQKSIATSGDLSVL